MISTSITPNSITIVITDNIKGNKIYTVTNSHQNYDKILDAIRKDDEKELHILCNIVEHISDYTEGNITIKNNQIFYKNLLLGGIIVERVMEFIKNKLPVKPLLKFLNKLMNNPSQRAVTELYKFLEHRGMPITPDGNFLAYKGVQTNYYSITAGKIQVIVGTVSEGGYIYNGIGETIKVTRNQVCDDHLKGCDAGLHAGSEAYAKSFGSGQKVVIVEIDPNDVVSIPSDSSFQKLRTCKYKVVGEYQVTLDNNYCSDYNNNSSATMENLQEVLNDEDDSQDDDDDNDDGEEYIDGEPEEI